MRNIVVTILNVVGLLVFGFFAWLQREDDNPAIYFNPSHWDVLAWTVFYGLVALGFGLALFRKFPRVLYVVIVVGGLAMLVRTFPGLWDNLTGGEGFDVTKHSMGPGDPRVELSREFFGVLIALAATAFLWWQGRRFSLKTDRG